VISDLDALALAVPDPSGTSVVSTGTVVAVDPAGHTVQVAIRADTAAAVVLPAAAARYRPGGSCRVLHNPADYGRAVLVLGAVDPMPPQVVGTLDVPGSSPAFLATVTVFGRQWQVQYTSGVYTAGQRVWVELDDWAPRCGWTGCPPSRPSPAPRPRPAPGAAAACRPP